MYTFFFLDYIFITSIKVICFKNFYITNVIILNQFLISYKANTKSRIKIEKSIHNNSIGYKNANS